MSALISRERSSIKCSISGALVASISLSSSSRLMLACHRAWRHQRREAALSWPGLVGPHTDSGGGGDGRCGASFRRGRRACGRRRLVGHCALDLLLRAVQLPADLGDRIERGIALRLAGHVVDLLLELGQLCFAHRLLKLTLKLR